MSVRDRLMKSPKCRKNEHLTGRSQKRFGMKPTRITPSWYKIADCIPFEQYVKNLSGVYQVLEKKQKSKSHEDDFLKNIWMSFGDFSEEQYQRRRNFERYNRSLQMKLGDMHRAMIGSFPNYRVLPRGHESKCDIERLDQTEFLVVTNNSNTLNAQSAKTVGKNLQVVIDKGCRAVLVQINCQKTVPRHGMPRDVELMSGKHIYAELSGRETFYDDLLITLKDTFAKFKTHTELQVV